MARFDMGAADVVAMAPVQATPEAYYELAMMYAGGRGAPPDLVAAHKWFNVAVARGCREAAERRAELAREMTREEIAAAQREARLWLQRH
jgi:TPR repeat protein